MLKVTSACYDEAKTMRKRPADLPDFAAPPLQEVAIGLQFDPTPGYLQAHVGAYWQRIRSDYPLVQDQARLETPIEVPGSVFGRSESFRVQFGVKLPRAWFMNVDGSYLIQMQDDRFIHNWRKQSSEYPRFEVIASQFSQRYQQFVDFLEEYKLRVPLLRQLEVTYINWIPAARLQDFLRTTSDPSIVIEDLRPQEPGGTWTARYSMLVDQQPIGSLTAEAMPGKLTASGEQGHRFALSARILLTGNPDLEALMFRSRNDIVRAFHALTTESRHQEWGYKA